MIILISICIPLFLFIFYALYKHHQLIIVNCHLIECILVYDPKFLEYVKKHPLKDGHKFLK